MRSKLRVLYTRCSVDLGCIEDHHLGGMEVEVNEVVEEVKVDEEVEVEEVNV